MATLTLRPVSNRSIGHTLNTGSSAFALVNESVSDGDSTYLYQSITGTSDASKESSWNLGTLPSNKIEVSSGVLYVVGRKTSSESKDTANFSITAACGSQTTNASASANSSYTTHSVTLGSNVISAINTAINNSQVPEIYATVKTNGKKNQSKNDDFDIRITQVYLTLNYTEIVAQTYDCSAVAGANISSASVSKAWATAGESITFSATLAPHCSFDGWYTAASGGTKVSSTNPYTAAINANTTLYARANKINYQFAIGAQPKAIRGNASVNKSAAQYPDTVIFTCNKLSSDYTFIGWFLDANYSNLVSTNETYTVTVTENLTLYPRVELLASRYISFDEDNRIVKNYFSGSNVSLDYSNLAGVYSSIVLYSTGVKSGYADCNTNGKSILYPNAVVHPVKLDLSISAMTTKTSNDDYIQFSVDNTVVQTLHPTTSKNTYNYVSLINSAIVNSTRNSLLRFNLNRNTTDALNAIRLHGATITYYYPGYRNQALKGSGVPSIVNISVSQSISCEYDDVAFSASVLSGATFNGWYSDAACTQLVSTSLSYTVSSTQDLTLYAKATPNSQLYNVTVNKETGISTAISDYPVFMQGSSLTFTATPSDGYAFEGWYINGVKVSGNASYTRIMNETANVTIIAKAIAVYTVTITRAGSALGVYAEAKLAKGVSVFPNLMTDSDWNNFYNGNFELISDDAVYDLQIWQSPTSSKTLNAPKASVAGLYGEYVGASSFNGGYDFQMVYQNGWAVRWLTSNSGYATAGYTVANTKISNIPQHINEVLVIEDIQSNQTRYFIDCVRHRNYAIASDGIASTAVSRELATMGDTTLFSAVVESGYVFDGWYSDAACTQLVSNELNYNAFPNSVNRAGTGSTEEPFVDTYTLYAKAIIADTGTVLYFKSGNAYVEAKAVYKKINGVYVEQTDIASLFNPNYKYKRGL